MKKKKKISKCGISTKFSKVVNSRKLNMFKYTELKNVRSEMSNVMLNYD